MEFNEDSNENEIAEGSSCCMCILMKLLSWLLHLLMYALLLAMLLFMADAVGLVRMDPAARQTIITYAEWWGTPAELLTHKKLISQMKAPMKAPLQVPKMNIPTHADLLEAKKADRMPLPDHATPLMGSLRSQQVTNKAKKAMKERERMAEAESLRIKAQNMLLEAERARNEAEQAKAAAEQAQFEAKQAKDALDQMTARAKATLKSLEEKEKLLKEKENQETQEMQKMQEMQESVRIAVKEKEVEAEAMQQSVQQAVALEEEKSKDAAHADQAAEQAQFEAEQAEKEATKAKELVEQKIAAAEKTAEKARRIREAVAAEAENEQESDTPTQPGEIMHEDNEEGPMEEMKQRVQTLVRQSYETVTQLPTYNAQFHQAWPVTHSLVAWSGSMIFLFLASSKIVQSVDLMVYPPPENKEHVFTAVTTIPIMCITTMGVYVLQKLAGVHQTTDISTMGVLVSAAFYATSWTSHSNIRSMVVDTKGTLDGALDPAKQAEALKSVAGRAVTAVSKSANRIKGMMVVFTGLAMEIYNNATSGVGQVISNMPNIPVDSLLGDLCDMLKESVDGTGFNIAPMIFSAAKGVMFYMDAQKKAALKEAIEDEDAINVRLHALKNGITAPIPDTTGLEFGLPRSMPVESPAESVESPAEPVESPAEPVESPRMQRYKKRLARKEAAEKTSMEMA